MTPVVPVLKAEEAFEVEKNSNENPNNNNRFPKALVLTIIIIAIITTTTTTTTVTIILHVIWSFEDPKHTGNYVEMKTKIYKVLVKTIEYKTNSVEN